MALGVCLIALGIPGLAWNAPQAAKTSVFGVFKEVVSESAADNLQPADEPLKIQPAAPLTLNLLPAKVNLGKEARDLRYQDGQVRKIKLRSNIKLTRDDFFIRYGNSLGLRLKPDPKSKYLDKVEVMKLDPLSSIARKDKKENTLYRYRQRYSGNGGPEVEVDGAQYVVQEVQQDEGHWVEFAAGKFAADLELDTNPKISGPQAYQIAVSAFSNAPADESTQVGRLLVTFTGTKLRKEDARLAWRYKIQTSVFNSFTVDVDAISGEILKILPNEIHESGLIEAAPEAKEAPEPVAEEGGSPTISSGLTDFEGLNNYVCNGNTRYDGERDFVCAKREGKEGYQLACSSAPDDPNQVCEADIMTIDARAPNTQRGTVSNAPFPFRNNIQESSVPNSWDNEDILGISVHWGIQLVVKYFSKSFGWRGFDGLGKYPILAYINDQEHEQPTAYYSPSSASFVFNKDSIPNQLNHLVSLDIIGHEFTHAMDHFGPNLDAYGESGSLKEAFADVLGILFRASVPGKSDQWILGEEVRTTGIRNIAQPKLTAYLPGYYGPGLPEHSPDTYGYGAEFFVDTEGPCYPSCRKEQKNCDPAKNNDRCGVHHNSTIVSHAFYLMAVGGEGTNDLSKHYEIQPLDPNPKKAREMAATLAFFTLLALPSSSNFIDTRIWAAEIAEEIFGSNSPQVKTVTDAFYAVGLGEKHDARFYRPFIGEMMVDPQNTKFMWSKLPGETQWFVEAATNPEFTENLLISDECTVDPEEKSPQGDPLCTTTLNLKSFRDYFWRVRALSEQPSQEVEADAESGGQEGKSLPKKVGSWLGSMGDTMYHFLSSRQSTEHVVEIEKLWGKTSTFSTSSQAVNLIAPGDLEAISPFGAVFKWTPVDGASGYRVEFSEAPDFSEVEKLDLHINPYENKTEIKGPAQEADEKTHYWQVTPFREFPEKEGKNKLVGPTSEVRSYTYNEGLTEAKLKYPLEEHAVPAEASPIEFKWDPVASAIKYEVTVFENSQGTEMKAGNMIGTPNLTKNNVPLFDFAGNSNNGYCWQVVAISSGGFKGKPSRAACFRFKPDQPVAVSPKTELPYSQDPVKFTWSLAKGAASYKVTLCNRDPATNGSLCKAWNGTVEVPGTETMINGGAANADGYCWQVVGRNHNGVEGKASTWSCYGITTGKPRITQPAASGFEVPYDAATEKYMLTIAWEGFAPHGYCRFHAPGLNAAAPVSKGSPCWGSGTGPMSQTQMGPEEWPATYDAYTVWIAAATPDGKVAELSDPVSFKLGPKPEKPKSEAPPQQEPQKSCVDLREASGISYYPYSMQTSPWKFHFSWNYVPGNKGYFVQVTKTGYGTGYDGMSQTVASIFTYDTQTDLAIPTFVPPNSGHIVNVLVVNECGKNGSISGQGVGIYAY